MNSGARLHEDIFESGATSLKIAARAGSKPTSASSPASPRQAQQELPHLRASKPSIRQSRRPFILAFVANALHTQAPCLPIWKSCSPCPSSAHRLRNVGILLLVRSFARPRNERAPRRRRRSRRLWNSSSPKARALLFERRRPLVAYWCRTRWSALPLAGGVQIALAGEIDCGSRAFSAAFASHTLLMGSPPCKPARSTSRSL